jgi:hypothetical protein
LEALFELPLASTLGAQQDGNNRRSGDYSIRALQIIAAVLDAIS